MKFSRLKLHGFKSFCDEMVLVMEPGLTGIVGPNGCGKSNLVEAMRWVMGESSYKAMRASGMDDVIFSGSGNRPGRNSAEVTLVLDNSDRTAPTLLNNSDILEVTRRIEREAGSAYRVNGKEVRARDVQLLFADASTGAHSPSMVRQGQIGELIAAKPTARRALLEEAAGISGLHSRRHEAELRLRGAETNLERVDDIIAQIDTQLETLKRQARLATRYRSLSGDIRRAEATLYHIRWVAARFAEKEGEAQQAVLIRQLADATHLEFEARKKLDMAEAAIQPLRDREAVTAAVLQRYTILLEQLETEARRAGQRQIELQDRLAQLATDGVREHELVEESEITLATYEAELDVLLAETETAQADFDRARNEADAAQAAVAKADAAARAAADALAQVRARRTQALRNAEEAAARIRRLTEEITNVERETQAVTEALDQDQTLSEKRAALAAAQDAAAETEQLALAAEEASAETQARLEDARPRLADIEGALNRLEAEAATLGKMLNVGASLWPAIVDELKVSPGYETALGAALGDDLEASSDAGAPMHWSVPVDHTDDGALPQAAEPLSRYVTGSALLKRRLDQIGLIDAVDGPSLMHALKPGQRLVTMDGALWRWDGFIAAADAPSAAARRIAQRNRLAELDEEIARSRGERNAWKRDLERLTLEHEISRQQERDQREAWRAAQHAIATAQTEVDAAQRAMGDLSSRQSALEEAKARLAANLEEAEAVRANAEEALCDAGTEDEASLLADDRQLELDQTRERADQTRLKLGSFETAARMRDGRMAQLERDTQSWQRRRQGALNQLATLDQRRAEIGAQLSSANETPDGFAARRAELEERIEQAKVEHQAAGDSYNVAQTGYRESDRALKAASDLLGQARIELTRIEERVKGYIGQRQQIERQIEEVAWHFSRQDTGGLRHST